MRLTFLIVFSMLFVRNTMYYTISLLCITCVSVFYIVICNFIQPLTGIMLLLVYLGAIMILIGYICAVSPNFITSSVSSFTALVSGLIALTVSATLFPQVSSLVAVSLSSPTTYFFTSWGAYVFALIAVMLFITLLIVTSQYFSPNGPFRSI